MAMDERKQRILGAVVSLYSDAGEPVGSGVLANYFEMAVSSATLRNEMAALTKLGLLEQPHTSAGRVPSAKGYRYYIDHILPQTSTPAMQLEAQIKATLAGLDQEPYKLVQGAVKELSKLTGYTAAITTPRADDLCIAHFEVVQVGRYSAAVLAVTSSGGVRTRVAHVKTGLTREDAASLAALLNRSMTFIVSVDLSHTLLQRIASQTQEGFIPVIQAAAAVLEDAANPHVFLGGEQNLLAWPELHEYLPCLLGTLNDEEAAGRIITPSTNHTTVFFGEDFAPAMPGLCIISKRYLVGGGLTGTISLLGPARMNFHQLIPVLETFASGLGECMAGKQ